MKIPELAGRALVAGINWALSAIFGPPKPPKKRAPTELDSQDVAIQNRASHPPEEHKQPGCCPFMRSGGLHGEDCYDQGREDCTALKRGHKVTQLRPPPLKPSRTRYDD